MLSRATTQRNVERIGFKTDKGTVPSRFTRERRYDARTNDKGIELRRLVKKRKNSATQSKPTMWTPDEDEKLRKIVEKHGAKRWNNVAAMLGGGKCAKQCRRRWNGHLTQEVKEGDWTAEEDATLLEAHERLGNKWTEIARLVGGRTDNGAKNRHKALVAKMGASRRRAQRAKEASTSKSTAVGKTKPPAATEKSGKKARGTPTKRKAVAVKKEEPAETETPRKRSKLLQSRDEVAAIGANGISPTLFAASPTASGATTADLGGAWRPTLSINIPSREQSAAVPLPSFSFGGATGAFGRENSVGRTLSLSCAELDLLREVQDMIGSTSNANNASAFVRYGNSNGGVATGLRPETSQGTADVMRWLLAATPTATPKNAGRRNKNDDVVTVSLPVNDDSVARGATLKHFLSFRVDSTTPKSTSMATTPASIPSFSQSELNLLLNALGSTSPKHPAAAVSPKVIKKPESVEEPTGRRTRARSSASRPA